MSSVTREPDDAGAVLEIRAVPFAHPDTQRLVAEVQQEYVARYGGPDEAPLEDGSFDPPGGAFFVGYEDGEPVAMGGWRRRSDVHPFGGAGTAELKRMYVAPRARRRGYAARLLAHLEATAAAAGAEVLVLETGTAQPEAIRLYESSGYERVEPFGFYKGYPSARHLGKRLRPAVAPSG